MRASERAICRYIAGRKSHEKSPVLQMSFPTPQKYEYGRFYFFLRLRCPGLVDKIVDQIVLRRHPVHGIYLGVTAVWQLKLAASPRSQNPSLFTFRPPASAEIVAAS